MSAVWTLAVLSAPPCLAQGEFLALEELNQTFPQPLPVASKVLIGDVRGNRAIVAGSGSGEVRFYVRTPPGSAAPWLLESSLTLDAEIRSVSIRGNLAAVGMLDLSDSTLPGAVQTYRRTGAGWQPEPLLTSIGAGRDAFGDSVTMGETSNGWDWLVIGAPRQEFASVPEQGFAFAYRRIEDSWALQSILEAPNPGASDRFGAHVSMDNDRLAVGAPFADPRVVMFEFQADAWAPDAVLRSPIEGASTFGTRLDLDQDRLIVGDPNSVGGRGRALLFQAPFTDASLGLSLEPDGPAGFFGTDVAVSNDVILVTRPDRPGIELAPAQVDVFQPLGGTWAQTQAIQASDSPPSQAGFGLKIALAGNRLITGDPLRPNPGTLPGAIYLFDLFPAQTTTYCTSLAGSSEHPANLWTQGSLSVWDNELELLAGPVPDQPGLFFYGAQPAAQPFGGGILCISGPPIFRLPIEQAQGGILRHELDLATPPGPAGQIVAGSQWRFQAWFRDPQGGAGATFRTSSAAQLSFVP